MALFGRLFGNKPKATRAEPVPFTPPSPDQPLYIIGDIHGRIDLLDRLLSQIDADRGDQSPRIITVGDYVDRGEQSAEVLARLHDLQTSRPDEVICLLGNHEKMMLDFLSDPEERGGRWLRNGGLQTLASYGVGRVTETSGPDGLRDARDSLSDSLPPQIADWLATLPLTWTSGNVIVVHAALDPEMPPDAQNDRTMLWGSRAFLEQPRRDGRWVAHGHTVVDVPQFADTRISCDTGAYYSGKLTAAVISQTGDVRFLQT